MTINDNAPAMQAAVSVVEPTPATKPHYSPSSMGHYFRCGESWRRTYIQKERQPPVLVMVKGTGMHKGAQANFTQKLQTHEDLPVQDLVAIAVAAFDEEIEKTGIALTDKDKAIGQEIAIATARDDVAKLAAAFRLTQAPHYQPVEGGIERRYRIVVPKSSHDLLGVIDLVATVGGKPGHHIRDFKTSGKKKSSVDSASSDQLTAYAAGHMVEFGFPAEDVGLDVLVSNKKGVVRQDLPEKRDEKDFAALATKINAMDAGVKAGIFLPADPGSWYCRPGVCPFHSTCPYVNHARIAAAKYGTEDEAE